MHSPAGPAALTTAERAIEAHFRAVLARLPRRGPAAWLTEFVVFGLKQAWACVFGGAMLAVIFAARLWYPGDAGFARNDFLTPAAVAIQIAMVAGRLESLRELRVVVLFHLVGTVMELFKTAAAIYVNFYTNHYVPDIRWLLIAAVALVFGRCVMQFRIFRFRWRMPLLLAFFLVAFFIWLAENIATWSNAWLYPSQLGGWHPVSPSKLASWFLLMIISVVLVTWISPPQPPDDPEAVATADGGRIESAGLAGSGR